MKTYSNERFVQRFDRDSGALCEDMTFVGCEFNNCAFSLTKSVNLRSTIRRATFESCTSLSCDVGPAVLEEVQVNGLATNGQLLLFWSPFLKHVTLTGKIDRIRINAAAHFVDRSRQLQDPFDRERTKFYKSLDWALDISEARFIEFEMQAIPARLVRRDPKTQVVVTRQRALSSGWREKLSPWNDYWPMVIDLFLEDGFEDMVLVAPKRKRKKKFERPRDGLNELRDLGVAEND